ncbi:hypothetical protein SDC9_100729 [bioreactor metagenome]|uniref:Uncharacterized protein n=1 Tax=bioreactor metagenome TaxID=1076179 RepID=A0A645ALN5_9ZZZZ
MNEARAAARQPQPVDRLGDLDLQLTVEPELAGLEGDEGVIDLETVPQHEALVDALEVVTLRLGR